MALDSLLEQRDIAPHRIPPHNLLLLALGAAVVDDTTIEEINRELRKRARDDSGSGSRDLEVVEASVSIPTTVGENMRSPVAASTSESSNVDVGNEKGLTGGGKRGKQVGKKAGAAGDVSGGGVS